MFSLKITLPNGAKVKYRIGHIKVIFILHHQFLTRAMLKGCVETQIVTHLTISFLKGREYRLPTQETFKQVGGKVDIVHFIVFQV